MNQRGTEWNHPCRKFTKITSQAKDTTRWHITIWYTIFPVPQATAMLDAKATVDKAWKKLETIPAWQMVSSWEQKEGDSGSTQRLTDSPRCCIDGHVPSQKKAESERHHRKTTSRTSRWHFFFFEKKKKTTQVHTQCWRNKAHLRHKWAPQN